MIPSSSLPTVLQPADLAAHQQQVTILDVRTPAEFAQVHIPGSYNVPLDQIAEHASRLTAAIGDPVVLVCRSGMRARQAEQALREHEMLRLHVLDGGISAWETANLPVVRAAGGKTTWSMERQVRGVAGAVGLTGALLGLLVWRPLGAIAAGIGGGLLFSAATDTCAMARVLGKLPWNRQLNATCDINSVIAQLESRPSGRTA